MLMTNRPTNQPPARAERPIVTNLVLRGASGVAYLAFISFGLSQAVKASYLLVLALVFITIMVEFALVLMLAAGWASQIRRGPFQLQLSSIFLIVVIIAIYLSALRWIVTADASSENLSIFDWLGVLIYGLIFIAVSFPFVLFLGEAMLWLAVWLVRRPFLTRSLRRLAQRRR